METLSAFPGYDVYTYDPKRDTQTVCKDTLNYVVHRYREYQSRRIAKLNRLMDSHNGVFTKQSVEFVNKTYGQQNVAKYIDFRMPASKINRLVGEFIEAPLNSTVYTINKDAKSEKLEKFQTQLGMFHAKDAIDKLRNVVGVPVFDGMKVPESEDDVKEQANAKGMNETIMQIMINKQTKSQDLKTKLADNFLDLAVQAEEYGKAYLNEEGRFMYRAIDPRNALFEELERDYFLENSPYLGERRIMFLHDILAEYDLDPAQIQELKSVQANPDDTLGTQGKKGFQKIDNNLAIEVYTIEWFAMKPFRTKISTGKGGEEIKADISEDYYRTNRAKIENDQKKGRYKIITKYKKVVWEGTYMGQSIYTKMQEKQNVISQLDNPKEAWYSYTGAMLMTRDGIRISLQETLDNIGKIFNYTMYQITRELAKAKGKIVVYDKAFLPAGKKVTDVLHQMVNDGLYVIDSSADGSYNREHVKINGEIREIDLGVSGTVELLLRLLDRLETLSDRLSGISPGREGNAPASTTVTNNISNIQASRSITAPMFYIHNRFIENILWRCVELTKISWGVLRPEDADLFLGEVEAAFLKATKDLPYDSFSVYLADSRREEKLRDTIRTYIEQGINSKTMQVQDAMEFELAETINEAVDIVRKGWETAKQIEQQHEQQMSQQQQEGQKEQTQAVQQSKQEDLEGKKALIQVQGQVDMALQAQKDKGRFIHEDQKIASKAKPNL